MTAALATARTLRDDGMAAAADAEARVQPEYAAQLAAAIVTVAKRQATVHIDDVQPLVTVQPYHANAAGPVWRRAILDKIIVATGRTRPCRVDPRKHLHNSPVYRSTLFGRATTATAPGRRAPAGLPGQIDLFREVSP